MAPTATQASCARPATPRWGSVDASPLACERSGVAAPSDRLGAPREGGPSRRRALAAGGLVWLALASPRCEEGRAPPLPAVTLLGARLVVDRPPQPRTWIFDDAEPARLWIDGAWPEDREVALWVGRRRIALETERAARDHATLVTLRGWPAELRGAARLVVERVGGPGADRAWAVELRSRPETLAPIAAASAARARGEHDRALAVLAAAEPADGELGYWIAVERARTLHQRGDLPGGVAAWRRAAERARALGLVEEVGRALRVASFLAWSDLDLAAQARLLDEADAADASAGAQVGPLRTQYHRGQRARELQDLRGAIDALEASAARAWSFGYDADWANATEALAIVLQLAGRNREACDTLDRVQPYFDAHRADRRGYARHQLTQAWILTRAMVAGAIPVDHATPRALWEAALATADDEPLRRANILSNLAWSALLVGDLTLAEARLAASREANPALVGESGVFVRLLEAELALARGDAARAAGLFEALGARAERGAEGTDLELSWQASFGLGRSLRALGRRAEARARMHDALGAIDALARRAAPTTSLAYYLADRGEPARALAAWHVADGELGAAFEVAERSRTAAARAFAASAQLEVLSPDARARWEVLASAYFARRSRFERGEEEGALLGEPARAEWSIARERERAGLVAAFDELVSFLQATARAPALATASAADVQAALGPRQALALVDGASVYWVTAREVAFAHAADDAADGAPLAPFASRIDGLDHLYVVAADGPRTRELSAWSPDGGPPLVERVGLSFLPHASVLTTPAPPRTAQALVIADPNGDLPYARREGRAVLAANPGARLLLGDAASRAEVLAAWDGARLVHFAGHGVARAGQPWDGHLELAQRQRLTLADVLVARPAAGVVVLSSCRSDTTLDAIVPLGFADAFVLSGTRAVLGADRVIADDDAAAFIQAFYAAGGAEHPARALTEATRQMRAAGNEVWRAFHLVGRP